MSKTTADREISRRSAMCVGDDLIKEVSSWCKSNLKGKWHYNQWLHLNYNEMCLFFFYDDDDLVLAKLFWAEKLKFAEWVYPFSS